MDIMVCGIVAGYMLQGVPGESVATVVVNRFDARPNEEEESLASGEVGTFVGDGGAEGVEEKAFEGVVV